MSVHAFSLVLTVATGWMLAGLGALPVATVRRLEAEPVKAAAAWAVAAATAPVAIFHWYLIFALICLVALTKLDRPLGKVCLALAAALALTLGVVFPLATAPDLAALNNVLALAPLYLGGAVTGLACLAVSLGANEPAWRGLARTILVGAAAWAALLVWLAPRLGAAPVPLHFFAAPGSALDPRLLDGAAAVVLLLAVATWSAQARNNVVARRLAGALAVTGLLANLLGVALLAARL